MITTQERNQENAERKAAVGRLMAAEANLASARERLQRAAEDRTTIEAKLFGVSERYSNDRADVCLVYAQVRESLLRDDPNVDRGELIEKANECLLKLDEMKAAYTKEASVLESQLQRARSEVGTAEAQHTLRDEERTTRVKQLAKLLPEVAL